MNNTQDYLDQLITDKQTIVNNINTKGGSALDTDTFTELAPKILDIPTSEEDLEEEMRIFDLQYMLTHPQRYYSENDYIQSEIDKVDDLLNKLGGENNG